MSDVEDARKFVQEPASGEGDLDDSFWLPLAELGIYRSVNQHRNSLKIVKSVLSATLKFSL